MNGPSLIELQQTFASALHYQASGEACDISSDNFTAEERIQIYRNNFVVSLSEVLAATYPMVSALVGEECFDQLARQHVLDYPLESGDVTYYGEHFNDSIERFPAVIEAAPYAPEVARFEWYIDVAQQHQGHISQPLALMPLAKIAEVEPEQQASIHLHLHTGVVLFHSHYAVFSLKKAIADNQFDDLQLNQAEQGFIFCSSQGEVWTQKIESCAFDLLQYLHSGCTLGEIPPEQLQHINSIFDSNIIAGFTLAD
ncbi:DNA-binding domain-containing protein [Vibrio sp. TBV020]|uniref:HvfC/BufC N-terminal domain-containing protein n=1 Tax=Vibrio sp. TBV020 TaxID=3137398 RepID=UPI0038CDA715